MTSFRPYRLEWNHGIVLNVNVSFRLEVWVLQQCRRLCLGDAATGGVVWHCVDHALRGVGGLHLLVLELTVILGHSYAAIEPGQWDAKHGLQLIFLIALKLDLLNIVPASPLN
jgi:hypothetical protein